MTSLSLPRLFIFTSDKYDWIIPATLHQIEKYWVPVPETLIAGFTPPSYPLPAWASFYSIGRFEDYPLERWSDALLATLNAQGDPHFIFFHEDYLLVRRVDTLAIHFLHEYALEHPNLLRIDLCTDRFYSTQAVEIGHLHHLDLIATQPPSPYRMSHQPSLFNSTLLRQIEQPGETPWQGEIEGTRRLEARPDLEVLGTRQAPIRHLIAINKGQLDLSGAWQMPKPLLPPQDLQELRLLFPILKTKETSPTL